MVDKYFQEKKFLSSRWATVSISAIAISLAVVFRPSVSVITRMAMVMFSAYAGFTMQAKKSQYNFPIEVFIRKIKEAHEQGKTPTRRLNFSYKNLKSVDLIKLGQRIQEEFKDFQELTLDGIDLTDEQLKQMAESGWFKNVRKLELGCNPQLTGQGIKWMMEGGCGNLEMLILDYTNLNDEALRWMAESGNFKKLKVLSFSSTQATSKGLEWIAKSGFESLEKLIVGEVKLELGPWLSHTGLPNLETFDLSCTKLTEELLSQMIEGSNWIKKLKGFDISYSGLHSLPGNISSLTNLGKYEPPQFKDRIDNRMFRFQGLIITGCFIWNSTPELDELIKAGKVFRN